MKRGSEIKTRVKHDADEVRFSDPEVYRVAKQLLKRYLPAFKQLASK